MWELMQSGNSRREEADIHLLLYPLSHCLQVGSKSFNNMIPDLDWRQVKVDGR